MGLTVINHSYFHYSRLHQIFATPVKDKLSLFIYMGCQVQHLGCVNYRASSLG